MSGIQRILIANRGEIACRVIRTCRMLDIASIAVYSEADRDAEHVRQADEAVCIGPAEAGSSYLNQDAILAAALQTGADAIHPGYGFLSENAEFAERVEAAGIVFIGPKPASMRAMGSKAGAKALMAAHGVPVIPGYSGDNQDAMHLAREAEAVGYPLMIKAAHGGGGKGMRIVRQAEEFAAALQACQREAKNAFGKDRVLLERYIEKPRHIEFQIFADCHGQTIHLGERECSAQRRFQKVLEESPSPFLSPGLREQMAGAAVKAARAVHYLNAGTVEFIVTPDGDFYFMEINSRLQVEHPVTEMVTGLDLVHWQIDVAEGKPLPLPQQAIQHQGHAIEVRLYAEDPERNFMPGSGVIERLHLPETGAGVRIDSGFREGDRVSVHYDPMLAKLIVHADDRPQALRALQNALAQCHIFGLPSNIRFLEQLIAHPVMQTGQIDTGYLDQHLDAIITPASAPADSHLLAAAYFILQQAGTLHAGNAADPWQHADFWRAHGLGHYRIRLRGEQAESTLAVSLHGNRLQTLSDGRTRQATLLEGTAARVALQMDEQKVHLRAFRHDRQWVLHDGRQRSYWQQIRAGDSTADNAAHSEFFVRAPMPGKLILLKVAAGQAVRKGEELAVMEAMKMELSIKALADATVGALLAEAGTVLDADAPILQWQVHGD